MRLIDADALIQDMEMHVTTMSVCSTTIEARAKTEMKRTCISDVANAPTIDAIPVIRCASCRWWSGSTLGTAYRCAVLHIATTGEFYCAAAERKCNAFADTRRRGVRRQSNGIGGSGEDEICGR